MSMFLTLFVSNSFIFCCDLYYINEMGYVSKSKASMFMFLFKHCCRQISFPARNQRGDDLLLFLGIIDILQNYRLLKKLEHTWKSVLHDGVRFPFKNLKFLS